MISRANPSGPNFEALVNSTDEIRDLTNNPPRLVSVVANGDFDRFEWNGEVDDGQEIIVAGAYVYKRRSYSLAYYAANMAVTDWYIDAVAGSDSNDGLTALTPLKTGNALYQRLGPLPVWQASMLVHVGPGGITDTLTLCGETGAVGVSVNVVGTPTLIADAGIISGYTGMDHVTPRSPTLFCTGIADFTPYLGKRVRITSGANAGACTWILKAAPHGLGLNAARTGLWYKKNDVTLATAMYSAVTPALGDPVAIESLPLVSTLNLELEGQVSLPGGNAWPQRQYSIDSLEINSLNRTASSDRQNGYRAIVFGCLLTFINFASRLLYYAAGRTDAVACLITATGVPSIPLNGSWVGLCALNVTITAAPAGLLLVGYSVLQTCNVYCYYSSQLFTDVQLFDAPGVTVYALNLSAGRASNISGDGNIGCGYGLQNMSRVAYISVQNLTGLFGNVKLISTPPVTLPLAITMASLLPIIDFARSGTSTLVGGTINVTVPYINWAVQRITFSRKDPLGTVGDLSIPTATRTSTSFRINSTNSLDVSTVEWSISPLERNIFSTTTV